MMSFHWSHYLLIARELYAEATTTAHEEANLRCSISRAYYAAFHHAKYKLSDKWNIPISHSATAHAQVPNFFKQKNEGDIAKKLRRMRIARNGADYDDQIANLKKIARDTLKLAEEVIKNLEKL
jgi:uncharacterized protein (UPF0332 family)